MTTFDHVSLVFLVRPADAPAVSDEEATALQDAHLAHQAALAERGLVLAAGPLVDQEDELLRGICVLSVDAERARALYADDPAVRARRLAVQVATWMVPTGGAVFPGVRLPASTAEALG
ncbi:hypothetical protein GCM10009557_67650 [Virgisporangium ochraceum]